MKASNIKPIIVIIVTLFSVTGLINSCKKADKATIKNNDIENLERVKNNVRVQIEQQGGIPAITLINQRIPMTIVDMHGNPVSREKLASMRLSSECAGDIPDFVDLKQYIRIFNCGSTSTSTIQYEYQLSWNNKVVAVSPYNSNNKTKGRVKIIYQPTNQTFEDKTTFDVSIKDLGVDPGNSNNNIYAVKFTCPGFTTGYLANNNFIVRLGATFVSDCPGSDSYGLAPADPAGYGITPGDGTQPCNRIDKAYFQAPGIIASNVIGVAGFNVFGYSCYSSFFVAPDLLEAQYSLNGGVDFLSLKNYTANTPVLPINGSKFIRGIDFAKSDPISPGTYNIVIKYKNWKYNSVSSQWQIPTTTTACRTYGNDNDNSYVYEYYPGTVIH